MGSANSIDRVRDQDQIKEKLVGSIELPSMCHDFVVSSFGIVAFRNAVGDRLSFLFNPHENTLKVIAHGLEFGEFNFSPDGTKLYM